MYLRNAENSKGDGNKVSQLTLVLVTIFKLNNIGQTAECIEESRLFS